MEKLKEFLNSSPDIQLRAFSSVFIVLAIMGGVILGGFVWDVIASAAALFSLWEFYKLQSPRVHSSPLLVMGAAVFILFGTSLGLMDLTAILCSISLSPSSRCSSRSCAARSPARATRSPPSARRSAASSTSFCVDLHDADTHARARRDVPAHALLLYVVLRRRGVLHRQPFRQNAALQPGQPA